MANPWWVNLLILVPFLSFWLWRRGLQLSVRELVPLFVLAAAFGIVEGAVVVYLRAIMASLAGLGADLAGARKLSGILFVSPETLNSLPGSLYSVELIREAATIIMLAGVAFLAAKGAKERWAAFLGSFAVWDIAYYTFLRLVLGWPASLFDFDILFLLPRPWFSQVWFPILVSTLTLIAVGVSIKWNRRFSK
jgi:hypothetical protein